MPIDLPLTYARAIKSAARRALGPMLDVQERSGVVFTMRAIGARGAEKKGAIAGGEEEDDDDVVSVQSEQSEVGEGQANGAQDPDLGAVRADRHHESGTIAKNIWPLGIGSRGCHVAASV